MINKLILLLSLAALVTDPAAGEEFEALTHKIPPGYEPGPEREEQGLWSEMEDLELSVNKSALLLRNGDLVDYINTIVCRVAADYCEDVRVYVIRNPSFNASMMPNGMMQIWTGLILRASSTDEIAAIVGHEISHYTRLHSLERLKVLNKTMSAGLIFDLAVVTTEVGVPMGRMSAALGTLAFSRDKESEADVLGAKLMADAGFDPHASYMLWEAFLEEQKAAVSKGIPVPGFMSTHPPTEKRAMRLRDVVTRNYGPSSLGQYADQPFLDVLGNSYMLLMGDQLETNLHSRTLEILDRHERIGVDPSLVSFFYGETYRQRDADGDRNLAMAAYQESIEHGRPPPEAYRNLAYLLLKETERSAASSAFRKYLELAPDASDRAMIEFYLKDLP